MRPNKSGVALAADPAASRPKAIDLTTHIATDKLLELLTRLPDPDEILRKAGVKRADLRKLLGDDEISGAMDTRLEAAISTPWRLEDGKNEVSDLVAFCEANIKRIQRDLFGGIWMARAFGYSVVEMIYKEAGGGTIETAEASPKPIQWFEPLRERGGLKYFPPAGGAGISGVGIPVDTKLKFILTRSKATYDNPYGEALLSRLYWPWYFRQSGWRFWMQFLERFGTPLLLAKTADPAKLISELVKMGLNSVVAVGQKDTLEAITADGTGEFDKVEAALCRRVQKAVLGQTLTTDTNGGSYALGQVHNLVRMDKRAADILLIQESVQSWLNEFVAFNFPGQEAPKFIMADNRGLEADRAKRDGELKKNGVVKSFSLAYLLDRYDFKEGDIVPGDGSEPEPDESTGSDSDEGAEGEGDKGKGKDEKTSANDGVRLSRRKFTREQIVLEDLADEALKAGGQPIDAKKIRSAILAAKDPQDLQERLSALFDAQRPEFPEILERALFAADVIGYVHADPNGARETPAELTLNLNLPNQEKAPPATGKIIVRKRGDVLEIDRVNDGGETGS